MTDFWIDTGFAVGSLVVMTFFFVNASEILLGGLLGLENAWIYGVGLVAAINVAHFFWGWFRVPDGLEGILPRGWRADALDLDRVGVRILALLTIGFSHYLKAAIRNYQLRR